PAIAQCVREFRCCRCVAVWRMGWEKKSNTNEPVRIVSRDLVEHPTTQVVCGPEDAWVIESRLPCIENRVGRAECIRCEALAKCRGVEVLALRDDGSGRSAIRRLVFRLRPEHQRKSELTQNVIRHSLVKQRKSGLEFPDDCRFVAALRNEPD